MKVDTMYFAVFFIEGMKQDFRNSEYKRINLSIFNNLTDGFEGKEVSLMSKGHSLVSKYSVVDVKSFGIENSVDNHLFAVVTVRKLKE